MFTEIWNRIAEVEEGLEGVKSELRRMQDELLPSVQCEHHLDGVGGRDEDPPGRSRGEPDGATPLPSDGELDAADDRADPGGVRGHGPGGPPASLPAATPSLSFPRAAAHLAGATHVEVLSGGWAGDQGEIERIAESDFGEVYVTVAMKVKGGVERACFRARLLKAVA